MITYEITNDITKKKKKNENENSIWTITDNNTRY